MKLKNSFLSVKTDFHSMNGPGLSPIQSAIAVQIHCYFCFGMFIFPEYQAFGLMAILYVGNFSFKGF